jgi:hypothetical protein
MKDKFGSMIEQFLNETSHWQFLNAHFKPSLTRFFLSWFALAPVFVKTVEGLPDSFVFSALDNNFSLSLTLPFSWKMLWWASFFYAVAFVLYALWCPGFIKRYPSYSAYTDRGHSPRWLVWEVFRAWSSLSCEGRKKIFERLVAKDYAKVEETLLLPFAKPCVSKNGTEWAFTHNEKTFVLRIDESLCERRQKDLFWEILARYGGSRPPVRLLIWFFLLIAGLLVLWVATQNILFVLNFLFK